MPVKPLACAAAMVALLLLPSSALATVTVSATATEISVTGTAGADVTTMTEQGNDLRFSGATAGAGCTQSGDSATCPRADPERSVVADLGAGNDDWGNTSAVPANVTGGDGDDVIQSSRIPGGDSLDGGAGSDTVTYAGTSAALLVDLPKDTVSDSGGTVEAVDGFENAIGGHSSDTLSGTDAPNRLNGGSGDDTIIPRLGPDAVDGGEGVDTISFAYLPPGDFGIRHTLAGPASGNSEFDTTINVEDIVGSKGFDRLTGTTGSNSISGGDGDDVLAPLAGNDDLAGDAGTDTLDYTASTVAIHAHLNNVGGLQVREFAPTQTKDELTDQFENLIGSAFADVLRGSDQANVISGGDGDDVIDGRNGNDILLGDSGNDRFGKVASAVDEAVAAAQVTVSNVPGPDGSDTLRAGPGNDDVNARDRFLDVRIDCGPGTDIARQDLVDHQERLEVDNCETLETTAIDQRMTVVVKVTGRKVKLECPNNSKVDCDGTAGFAKRAAKKPKQTVDYEIRKGKSKTIKVPGSGKYLKLTEQDQDGDDRLLVMRK